MSNQEEIEIDKDSIFEMRHTLNITNLRYMVAMQIKAMRDSRGWSQDELAEKASLKVSDIARMENPKGGNLSIDKIKQVAKACDVGLLVSFVPFGITPSMLSPLSFDKEALAEERAEGIS